MPDSTDDLANRSISFVDRWIGSRLQCRRLQAGMNLTAFAAALGVSIDDVERWEAGLIRIPSKALLECVSILHIHLIDLFGGMPENLSLGPVDKPDPAPQTSE